MTMLRRPNTLVRGLAGRTRKAQNGISRVRRVYFSLNYEHDLKRVQKIRLPANIIAGSAGGLSGPDGWQKITRRGPMAVRGVIDDALSNTVATVVCIGSRSIGSRYLDYELERSLDRGNALLGLRIGGIPDEYGQLDEGGQVPPTIRAAGYKVHTYTNPGQLVVDIEEAIGLARQYRQRERLVGTDRALSAAAYA
jgi:hypothetical protein